MSYEDAFGPPKLRDQSRSSRAQAIAWVRRSIFSRSVGNPHRSELAVAVMYAAEHLVGGAPLERADKHKGGWDSLMKLSDAELQQTLRAAAAARAAAPNDTTKMWAGHAIAALSKIRTAKPLTAPRKWRAEDGEMESDADFARKVARLGELNHLEWPEIVKTLRAEGFMVSDEVEEPAPSGAATEETH